jgi:hypothetical protein
MPTPQLPEESPPQPGGQPPDLSLREMESGRREWQEDSLDSRDSSSTGDKPGLQSIFSKRSGIQDPLLRPDIRDDKGDAPPEANTPDGQAMGPVNPEQNEPAEEPAERKVRKGKGQPRLVKSKRHLDRARRRQKNYLQERREKKKLRVFYHRIRVIFKLCFALLWCALLWELVHSPLWLFNQPRFTVSDAQLLQPNQVAPWVRRQVGQPIYTIDTGKLAKKIKENFDIVSLVSVRRQLFPARLEIMIQEKKPWAEIYATDPNPPVKANPSGEQATIPAKAEPSTKAAPRPYGLMVPNGIISLARYHYQPGVFGSAHPLEKIIVMPKTVFSYSYLERLQELTWQARQIKDLHLMSVDVRNPNRIIFNYQELPVILGRMNSTSAERLSRLIPLIPKINEYRDGMESVDLQWEEQVTFHQKPNAKLDLPKQEQTQG